MTDSILLRCIHELASRIAPSTLAVKIRRESIVIPRLKADLDRYTILHVSDLHYKEYVGKSKILHEVLYSGSADLILITGDFITGNEDIDPVIEYLRSAKSRDGIYAILGNHDYVLSTIYHHMRYRLTKHPIQNDHKRLLEELERIGIKVLVNRSAITKVGDSQIFIEGTDDPDLDRPEISDVDDDYRKSDLRILMSHSPDILYSPDLRKKEFDLILAGHTHGGQIRLPGIGPVATGTRHARRIESLGLYKRGNTYVNVSAGIGYSALPFRINCPPEVVEITLMKSR